MANLRVIQSDETPTPRAPPAPPLGLWARLKTILVWLFTGKAPAPKKREPRAYVQLDQMPGVPDVPMQLPSYDIDQARKKSLMHQQKIVCNGEKLGHQCRHYWKMTIIADSANPEHLRKGETFRWCTYLPTIPHNIDDGVVGAAVECNQYTPDTSKPYNEDAEAFRPLTPDQIRTIQQGNGTLTEADLVNVTSTPKPTPPQQTVSIDDALEALTQEQKQ